MENEALISFFRLASHRLAFYTRLRLGMAHSIAIDCGVPYDSYRTCSGKYVRKPRAKGQKAIYEQETD